MRSRRGTQQSAAQLAQALGGRKKGGGWTARCPAHDDRNPSLSIRETDHGKVLVHCHAGCSQTHLIAALHDRGLWFRDHHHCNIIRQWARESTHDLRDDAERTSAAVAIWHQARPAAGSIVETYLRGRGIFLDALPPTLRFHPSCCRPRHDAGRCVSPLPALVALVEHAQRGRVAVHATYLHPDRSGKADIPKQQQKACFGPIAGGALRLGTAQRDQWLAIGEGIETTLTVMQACGLPGWAALSANGIKNLVLPPEAAMVLICADHDANGVGQRAAYEAAERFLREGRRVRIAMPPPDTDFNDIVTGATVTAMVEARHVA
jgi:putative DNA primase/helicase